MTKKTPIAEVNIMAIACSLLTNRYMENRELIEKTGATKYIDSSGADNQCSRLKEYLTRRRIDFKEKVDGKSVIIEIGNVQANTKQSH